MKSHQRVSIYPTHSYIPNIYVLADGVASTLQISLHTRYLSGSMRLKVTVCSIRLSGKAVLEIMLSLAGSVFGFERAPLESFPAELAQPHSPHTMLESPEHQLTWQVCFLFHVRCVSCSRKRSNKHPKLAC